MSACQIELRNAGKSYPRTCPTCGLSGACVKGLSHGTPVNPTADLTARGAPKRIWASFTNLRNEYEGHCYRGNTVEGTRPYILATPTALAEAPEVQALIREAEARGMERMKPVLIAYEELLATVQGECSSLLDPCRGGSDLLANLIIQANTTIQEQNDD